MICPEGYGGIEVVQKAFKRLGSSAYRANSMRVRAGVQLKCCMICDGTLLHDGFVTKAAMEYPPRARARKLNERQTFWSWAHAGWFHNDDDALSEICQVCLYYARHEAHCSADWPLTQCARIRLKPWRTEIGEAGGGYDLGEYHDEAIVQMPAQRSIIFNIISNLSPCETWYSSRGANAACSVGASSKNLRVKVHLEYEGLSGTLRLDQSVHRNSQQAVTAKEIIAPYSHYDSRTHDLRANFR